MRIRKTWKAFDKGRDVSLVFACASGKKTQGKFVVGVHPSEAEHLMIVFDDSAGFHRDLALRYRLRARGGGWLEWNATRKCIRLSGRSQAYGREPDRELTRRVLQTAFPDFSCTCES
ncbi:MAG: hypothetical protein HY822_11275 [Acidobacteria bacterium]|nr:hypothetical protein [Acidobacteriota bacterium]